MAPRLLKDQDIRVMVQAGPHMLRLLDPTTRFDLGAHLAPNAGVAVLLNARAKAVNEGVRRALSLVVPPEDLFLSRSQDEAAQIADHVVARRYRTVFTGGGDGTGNAVAEMVGATPRRHAEDLARFVAGEVHGSRKLDLVTCEGRRTPFAGVGVDAAVLNDYIWLKERLAGTPLQGLGLGLTGYGLAAALRSAPRALMARRATYCEIVNAGRPAWRLDAEGRRVGPAIAPGELLFAGPCMMASASTVPYYGLGLKAFPWADKAGGMMQLRVVSAIGVAALALNLGRIWDGTFSHEGLLDFHADRVALRFERPMPLQVGGDAEGWRDEITFGVAASPVEMVDFGRAAA